MKPSASRRATAQRQGAISGGTSADDALPGRVYDQAGRLSRLVAVNSNTGNQTTLYAYDARGNQVTTTYPVTGNVISAYDAVGNLTLRTDEAGVAVQYDYDEVNRLTERKENGGTSNIEQYAYDALGRLVTARKGTSNNDDAVSRSVFAYDPLSRVTQEAQAIAEGTAKAVDYTYDQAGNRLTLQHDDGAVTAAYAYDP